MLHLASIVCAFALSSAPLAPLPVDTMPNLVAAGEVTPYSAVLWTRTTSFGLVHFWISENAQFQGPTLHRIALSLNPKRPVKVLATPLKPGTLYYYKAKDSAGTIVSGTFRSAPASHANAHVRFGVSGDSRGDVMPFGSVSNAVDADLDFFVMLGDTVYADVPSPAQPGLLQAKTLDEFRLKHDEVLSSFQGINGLGELRRATAIMATIDDHEVTNDFAGGAHPSTNSLFDLTGNFINETKLYGNGVRAFVEYYPLIPSYYGFTGDPRTTLKRKLYREHRYGKQAVVLMLDARSFRDVALPPANPLDPSSVQNFLISAFDPSRTMLSAKQLSDVQADLLAAEQDGVRWKFVLVPEPIQNLGVVSASDRFEGYAAERTKLLAFIAQNQIKNVVFVAADIHGSLVNDLSYQTAPGQPQIPIKAFEITTGPVAYDAPFGPTVVGLAFQLGLISQQQFDLYNSLPTPGKDAFVRGLVDQQLLPLGYNPIGLEGSSLSATLLEGSYVATHVYGWSEFDIEASSGALTVTTFGVDPDFPLAQPSVQQRFRVLPQ